MHQSGPFRNTILFLKTNFAVIFTLGLIAGTGRAIQMNGFGETGPKTDLKLEVIIEAARLLLLIKPIGSASFSKGFSRLGRLLRKPTIKKQLPRQVWIKAKAHWRPVLLNCILYAALAWGINIMIDQLAYETCLYQKLKQEAC